MQFTREDVEIAARAYQKYRKGTFLTDEEIATAIKVLTPVHTVLFALGDSFRLEAVELMTTVRGMGGFMRVREAADHLVREGAAR